MIGDVCVEMIDAGGPFLQFGFVAGFDRFFPVRHDLIQLLDGSGPGRLRKGGKGLVVVTAEGGGFGAVEMIQLGAAPKEDMIGQFAHGVGGVGGFPHGLLGGETFDGDGNGNIPVFLVPGVAELFQEDRAKGYLLFFLRLLGGGSCKEWATADT